MREWVKQGWEMVTAKRLAVIGMGRRVEGRRVRATERHRLALGWGWGFQGTVRLMGGCHHSAPHRWPTPRCLQ